MPGKTDTLLAQCVLRATTALARRDVQEGRDPNLPATLRERMRATVKATTAGSRVAALIVMWATALLDLDRDEISVSEYVTWAADSQATVYRRLAEFRDLWPEYETPNELSLLVARHAEGDRLSATTLIPVPT